MSFVRCLKDGEKELRQRIANATGADKAALENTLEVFLDEKALLLKMAATNRRAGLGADEAGRKAVDEQIAKVQAMLDAPAEVAAPAPEPAAPAVEQPEAETDAESGAVETKATTATVDEGVPAMPAVLGIPREAAQNAHRGTSHVPEVRAGQEQQSFMAALADAWQRAARMAGKDKAAIERITEVFRDVADGYRARYMRTLEARSRVMSSMIDGPARFPVERNRKRMETERKRAEEAGEYLSRGIKRLLKAARGPIDNSPESELESVRLRLAEREEAQEMMKAANLALRKGDDAALEDLGLTAEQIAGLKKGDFAGRKGFPDYKLTNNNAEIRRLRSRLEEAEARLAAAQEGPQETERAGVRIVEDAQEDRLRLIFDGKPDEAVRETLKANGFRWSPKAGAWQRQLTGNARYAAKVVLDKHFPADGDTRFSRKMKPEVRAANFDAWAAGAEMVSREDATTRGFKTGEAVVVEAYHGTKRPDRVGTVFQRKRATSGPMAYFTADPTLASSYAQGKQDTSLGQDYDGDYAQWFKVKIKGERAARDIERAWWALTPDERARITELAPRVTTQENEDTGLNDIVLGPESVTNGPGSYDYEYAKTKRGFAGSGNPLRALVESWLASGLLFDEELDFLKVLKLAGMETEVEFDSPRADYPFVYKTLIRMGNPLVTSDIPAKTMTALEEAAKRDRSRADAGGADSWDKNTRTLREWVAQLKDPERGTYAWTSIPDKVTEVLKAEGYDGIIDWSGKGGGDIVAPVYVPFVETQVKSALGNRGTFDAEKKDILYSRASTGRGIPESDARNLASILRAALPKAPPIIIHDSVDKAPQSLRDAIYAEGAERDVEAAYHEGEIHVFPGHIESAERFNFVVGHHEMRHYGIRGILGQQYKQVLTGIAMRNPTLRAAARAKQDAGLAKDLATGVDEALADMPVEEIAALSGIDRLVSRIRQWLRETAAKLREHKLFALADAIDPKEWTDKDVAHFVWKVEDFARRGGSPMSTGGTMFGRDADEPPFYSALTRAIDAAGMKAAPAGGWSQFLKGQVAKGAVKQDEITWSGVEEWLALQQGKVNREDLSDFVRQNGVRVTETVLGDEVGALPEGWEVRPAVPYADDTEFAYVLTDNDGEIRGAGNTQREAIEDGWDPDEARPGSKYSQYTLPGGTNYREVLLTLPDKTGADRLHALEIKVNAGTATLAEREEYYDRVDNLNDSGRANTAYRSNHWEQTNILAHIRVNDRTDAEGKRVLFVEEIQSDWAQAGAKKTGRKLPDGSDERVGFQRPFAGKAPEVRGEQLTVRELLAREGANGKDWLDGQNAMRADLNERPLTDSDPVQVIYEDGKMSRATSRIRGTAQQWADQIARDWKRLKDTERQQWAAQQAGKPPLAPFIEKTDAWVALAIKRVISIAVDGGYDKVAFVTGEQSAERYKLSATIERLQWRSNGRGADRIVELETKEGPRATLFIGQDGKIGRVDTRTDALRRLDGKMLDEAIGKDMAEKVMSSASGDETGAGLDVGGRGMITFYDKIVPSTLKDVLRKVGGGAMETVQVSVGDKPENPEALQFQIDHPEIYNAETRRLAAQELAGKTADQPGFSITQQMKDKALGGMPLFSRTDQTQTPASDTIYQEIAADEEMIAALETYMASGDAPEGAMNDKLVAYLRRLPPVPADSYLTFYRNQPSWGKPWKRGWSSWTTNEDQTRYFGGRDFEVLKRKGAQGLNLGRLGELRSKLTGEYYEYGSQGEWLLLNDSVFSPASSDTRFSRAGTAKTTAQRQVTQAVRNTVADMLGNAGAKVSWWDKTLGTQYAKARKFRSFGIVFDKVQEYIEDTSTLATQAADMAPDILPKLEKWSDFKKMGISAKDAEAVAAPIFEGTLSNERYDEATLRSRFGLNDRQVNAYGEFYRAVNESLDQVMAAEVIRLLGDKSDALRSLALEDRAALRSGVEQFLDEQVEANPQDAEMVALRDDIRDKYARVDKLKADGYAPLMRFGRYKVHIVDPSSDQTMFFGLYESAADANRAARELMEDPEMQGFRVEQGVLSEKQYEMFAAMPMDSLEMFAEALGAQESDVFKEYIRLAKNNRSALKRLLKRKGTAGYSTDARRVLAAFVTSNARLAAGALNLPGAKEAALNIRDGDVQDEAIGLIQSIQNPQGGAAWARGLMFVNFIGGSIASALVNVTQPLTMTLPWLSQWGGMTKAGKRLMEAGKIASTGKGMDAELAAALKRAEDDGIVSPQEIHYLQSQAMGKMGGHPILQRAAFIWAAPFTMAEQFNRRTSFIAAYLTAKQEGMGEAAFDFAQRAVIETQGLYNPGNQANWARNPVGAAVLTFKQFSVHYLEWMRRMWSAGTPGSAERKAGRKAVLYAMAILILAAGTEGLPFADDLDDLIDTIGQALGYDLNSKRARREFVANTLGMGDLGADVVARGFSAMGGVPFDVSLRMSMGNLVPGTGMLLRSNVDKSREVLELAGPAGGLIDQYTKAGQKALQGDAAGAALQAMPVAIQNVGKAVGMWTTGEARDSKDRRIMEADTMDGLMRFLGFNPQSIARESDKMGMLRRSEQLAKNVEGEIAADWARAQADGDREGVQEAKQRLRDWNDRNHGQQIRITGAQILRRVQQLRRDRRERFITSTSPERRREVSEALQ